MRILVAGTGFTGSRILTALRKSGHEVLGLNRRGEGSGILAGDVLVPESLKKLKTLPAFDLLISTLSGSGQRDPERYRSIYVDGPRRMMDQMIWRGAPQVWMLGSTGVYGVGDGRWVDETTPAEPVHRTGQVQVDAEQALQAHCDQTCVLRLSGLYGPGRTRLIRQALRKRPFLKPELWANQIHADDVAGLVAFLVDRETAPPTRLLVSDCQPAPRKEIFEWVRKEMNLPEGLYDEDHPVRAGADRGNKRVDSSKMQALGYKLKYPGFRDGLGELMGNF
ncbi:NAD-dependent epimerase/dehydratase family protein [Kiritimatiellaeota bacterium B1221]|nr:NAD-dependent epimerase/dehydratase family protein [Kiritimatiellaeota bacterium B1221]